MDRSGLNRGVTLVKEAASVFFPFFNFLNCKIIAL